MSRYIDADALLEKEERGNLDHYIDGERCYQMVVPSWAIIEAPSIDIVRCRECKHRPVKEDADGADFGFNIIAPEGSSRCPCLVDDGWYSWMPKDDFFCGYGESKEGE